MTVTAAVAAALIGCGDKQAPQAGTSTAPIAAPDQVASGEVPESAEEAFGLVLPRGMRVTRRDYDMVMAEGSLPPEDVSNYIRARIEGGIEETGPGRTTFLRTQARKPATAWKGTLRIDVDGDGQFTQLRVVGEEAPDLSGKQVPAIPTASVRAFAKPGPGDRSTLPPRL